jgi:hypothetical protein
MPHQHSFHINKGVVDHRWLGFDELETRMFPKEFIDDQGSTIFLGNTGFCEVKQPMTDDQ